MNYDVKLMLILLSFSSASAELSALDISTDLLARSWFMLFEGKLSVMELLAVSIGSIDPVPVSSGVSVRCWPVNLVANTVLFVLTSLAIPSTLLARSERSGSVQQMF